ncbi:MAG: type IV secretion system DNA-binding domain-containing protein [Patescibacteria group bacterium]|nr:type IV secretion system DNA-binding domain-containing protein [Patescibacteria group bacterium]
MAENKVVLELRTPKTAEETPGSMEQVFAALFSGGHIPHWKRLWIKVRTLSFEIASFNQTIHFYSVVPESFRTFMESQLTSQYPKILITKVPDYIGEITRSPFLAVGNLQLAHAFYYPIKTFSEFKELDPMSSIIGVLSKLSPLQKALIQIVIEPPHFNWQGMVTRMIERGIPDPTPTAPDKTKSFPHASIIETKLKNTGYRTYIRLLVGGETDKEAKSLMFNLAGSFGAFALGEGNRIILRRPRLFFKKVIFNRIIKREKSHFPRHQIFNTAELATIFHPPTMLLAGIKNIAWGRSLVGEPPQNLPVALGATEEQKSQINFFAKAEFKNSLTTFGVKKEDRRKHVYVIGKTGTGKSTMIANLAINDMRNREGLAVVDPHGDLSEILLHYVPSYRINDVVYLEPFNQDRPFWINPLEVKNPVHRELVASGIVSIFSKLYAYSWGPRLEYILRNVILTLLEYPNATLTMALDLLADQNFRQGVLLKVQDRVLQNFWHNEFDKMHPRLKSEAIAPIQNKVGQFVQSPTIRQIIGHSSSTIDLEDIMNQGKILILNLAQGKLGEDNAALLGAMFITKMQLAAMNRVNMPEAERKDFYLYVDEFQNFATSSFIKILSEARKYRLDLILANQYIGQLEETVQKAIFGNAGTLISFVIGAQDAAAISKEFGQWYKEEDLVNLGSYQIVIKLAIDNLTSLPFHAVTLPLPKSVNQNRDKVVRLSLERYTKNADPTLSALRQTPASAVLPKPQTASFTQTPSQQAPPVKNTPETSTSTSLPQETTSTSAKISRLPHPQTKKQPKPAKDTPNTSQPVNSSPTNQSNQTSQTNTNRSQ